MLEGLKVKLNGEIVPVMQVSGIADVCDSFDDVSIVQVAVGCVETGLSMAFAILN